MIEPCWGDLKDECEPHWHSVRGGGAAAHLDAEAAVCSEWRQLHASCRHHAEGFLERLGAVEKHGGSNIVRG